MSRCLILLVIAAAGCRNIDGPCAARNKPPINEPGLTISEQERRARDKYPIPSDNFRIGPPTGIDPTGGMSL